jgi:hypothetical protein
MGKVLRVAGTTVAIGFGLWLLWIALIGPAIIYIAKGVNH